MKWQCWKCSSDDGCELVDLVGGDPVHEPNICPWGGGQAEWKRVEESAPSVGAGINQANYLL